MNRIIFYFIFCLSLFAITACQKEEQNTQTSNVVHKDGDEELMNIKSGSVFVDHFTLEVADGEDKMEVTLRAQ